MEKGKRINWNNVIIGLSLIILGFLIGLFGTIYKVNRELEANNIDYELNLFK